MSEDRFDAPPGEFKFPEGASAEFLFEKGVSNEDTKKLAKVKLGVVYEEIVEILNTYMDMPQENMKIIASWIIGTYYHSSFSTFPFLFINAMRGSGKTRLLKILANLCKGGRGEVQTGVSEAVLFRSTPGDTLIMDECESIGTKEKSALREYLNACYKKGGTVKRTKKAKIQGVEEWVIERFQPYKPIALANIWGIEEVLGDRCISFILEKSNNPLKTKLIEDFEENPDFLKIRDTLRGISVVSVVYSGTGNYIKSWNNYILNKYNYTNYIPTETTLTTLTTQNTEDPLEEEMFNKIDGLNIDGRNFELLFPLLMISRHISEEAFNTMLLIGGNIIKQKKENEFAESRDVMVYEFVSKQDRQLELVPIKELTRRFKTFIGAEEEWINERWVGKALKRLNLVLNKTRQASGVYIMLNIAKASEKTKMFGGKNVTT